MYLAAQCSFADRGETVAQCRKCLLTRLRRELSAKAIDVAKYAVINHADQAIKLQQRVLQRCGGQQHLGMDMCKCFLERLSNDVAGFVDIAQTVGFIKDHQVPVHGLDVCSLRFSELVRTNDRARRSLEWILHPLLAHGVVAFGFQEHALQVEFVLQLLVPLLA